MGGEMGLTPEELAGLTLEELAELRRVYAQGHAAGFAVGYAESYVKGMRGALADRGLDANTTYFRCFDCSGVLLPLCSVSFFESVFVMA
jgi:hypothetical protein